MSFNTFASSTLNPLMHSVPLPRVYREVEIPENAKRYLHKVIDYDPAEAPEHAEPIDSDLVNASIKAAEHAELIDFGSADLSKIKAFDNHALAYVVKHAEKHLLFLVLAPEYPFEERNLKGPKNQALVWYIPKGAGGPGSADQQFNTRDIEPTYQAETYMDLLPVLPRVPIF